jgi:DNA-binding Xre family transcriptional regulator
MLGIQDVAARFRLREALEEAAISQSELARRSGISFQTINSIVGNRTGQVSLNTLDALSKALGCEPGDLIEREGKRRRRG